jgi:hypothetical protein
LETLLLPARAGIPAALGGVAGMAALAVGEGVATEAHSRVSGGTSSARPKHYFCCKRSQFTKR